MIYCTGVILWTVSLPTAMAALRLSFLRRIGATTAPLILIISCPVCRKTASGVRPPAAMLASPFSYNPFFSLLPPYRQTGGSGGAPPAYTVRVFSRGWLRRECRAQLSIVCWSSARCWPGLVERRPALHSLLELCIACKAGKKAGNSLFSRFTGCVEVRRDCGVVEW